MKTSSITLTFLLLIFSRLEAQTYIFTEVLQKSLYFYDAEKSGPGITGGKLTLKGDAELSDRAVPLNTTMTNMSQAFISANKSVLDPDNNGSLDVNREYHNVGDHVRFGLQDPKIFARPASFATAETFASDQFAGAAASLAISYSHNITDKPAYANKCLTAAKVLYDFAIQNRGFAIQEAIARPVFTDYIRYFIFYI